MKSVNAESGMNRPITGLLLAITLLASTSACTRIKDLKGYIADDQLITALQPGVDNRSSVQKTLGRPTIISEVDSNTWYYVSQNTQQLAFFKPRPLTHQVVVVRFDPKGNLAKVEKLDRNAIVDVDPSGDKTPTRGKEVTFWQELFGDVGRFGPGGAGGGGPE
jgi:outer membrane protein assembly factor BamE (lipoprotein component of BamABCDE complex)